MRTAIITVALLLLSIISAPQRADAAPVFERIVSSAGLLLGASNIEIGNEFYDVAFQDGQCSAVFDGCDESADFLWQDAASAAQASARLFELVLVGSFDTSPNLTLGCDNPSAPSSCSLLTVFPRQSLPFGASRASNSPSINDFPADVVTVSSTTSSSGNQNTWAVWSRSSAAVPEPSSLLLLLSSLLLLGAAQHPGPLARARQRIAQSMFRLSAS